MTEFKFKTQEEYDALTPEDQAGYDANVRKQWAIWAKEEGWPEEPKSTPCQGYWQNEGEPNRSIAEDEIGL